jgi:outer membrane receptor protein involved in Fe transport
MFKYALASPGGVINIITKKGGPQPFGGSVYGGYGSYDTWRGGAKFNGAAQGFDYSAGYEYSTVRRNYKDGNGHMVYNTKTDGTHSFFANTGYTIADRHRIGFDVYHYKVDNAQRPAYVDDEGVQRDNNYTDRETLLYYMNYEGSTEDRHWLWNLNIGYGQDNYYTYTGPDSVGRVSYYPKGQETESFRAQGNLTYTTGLFDVSGGMDYIKYEVANSSTARGAVVQNIGGWPMHDTSTSSIWGTYLMGTLKLLDGSLNLSGGLRYEYATAKDLSVGDELWGPGPPNVPYFNNQGLRREDFPTKHDFDHLSPSLGISYLPLKWLKLRGNYTQGWRAPSGRQLYASSFYEDYGAPGDPRLNPEKTDAYEVGFDLTPRHLTLSGTWFYYKIKDNIYIYPGVNAAGTGANGRVMMNAEERVHSGFEINASVNLAGLAGFKGFEVRPYFNITHMTQKEELLRKDGPNLWSKWWPILRQPDTTMSYGVRFTHYDWKFSANLNVNYYGEQYGGRSNVTDGPLSNFAFGKFSVVNLSMRKELVSFGKYGNVEAKLNVNNLLNEQYSYLGRVPSDSYAYQGRNFFATLIYNF